MHGPRPEIDHLRSLLVCAQVADVLVKSKLIILFARRSRLQRLGLDVISNFGEVVLLLLCELWIVGQWIASEGKAL